jgi:hypothetical protein
MKTTRIRMNVSIAGTDERGRDFSAQPGDVIDVETSLAKKWLRGNHGTEVPRGTQLTERDLNLADLDLEEALTRWCEHCPPGKRAETVFRNKALCRRHARAEMES